MSASLIPDVLSSCLCCECLVPKYRYRSRSASITKCGYAEYAGHVSTPPKIYRTVSITGLMRSIDYTDLGCSSCITSGDWRFSGSSTYARGTCGLTVGGVRDLYTNSVGSPCLPDTFEATGTAERYGDIVVAVFGNVIDVKTATTRTISGDDVCTVTGDTPLPSFKITSAGTPYVETLSNEYTTAQLVSDVSDSVVAASYGSWSALADATSISTSARGLRDLSTDEETCTIRETEIEVRCKIPGNGTCFRVPYQITFIPSDGSGVIVLNTGNFFQWDGTVPGGYDPADSTTWPVLTVLAFDLSAYSIATPYGSASWGELRLAIGDPLCEGCV